MSLDINNRLYAAMLEILETYVTNEKMKKQLYEFIKFKQNEGYLFGDLVILHYLIYKNKIEDQIIKVAAAIELLILSFDILDDVEDQDNLSSPWIRQQSLSLNISSYLIFLCHLIIVESDFKNKYKALELLVTKALCSIEGQHLDLLNDIPSEDQYIEMVILKSGSLAELACLIGTILADPDKAHEVQLYGSSIGVIGQIQNDIEGMKSWDKKNDILNKKFTLPILFLLSVEQNHKVTEKIRNYYNGLIKQNEILILSKDIDSLLEETGAFLYSKVTQQLYRNKAESSIMSLTINRIYKEALLKYI
ncbi:polyprenyl synthetase family protein [Lysinibacillus xylanilyticus]|uniref:polyprenyl synthetase family protein n=1 Tax=Lysinibacillus xylanilyticus TaxID=582475 RepID=UPI003CFEE59D